ncbi:MAG: site-specific integrase [Anaerolineae bacterium]|nr:site-specific integrase [Anaerolineae bacterium]
MIERANYFDVMEYLDYQGRVKQQSPKTVKRKWGHLRHLLNWADGERFNKVMKKGIQFPVFLQTARNDNAGKNLSLESVKRACAEARNFYIWAKQQKGKIYKEISIEWIETIRPSREMGMQSKIKEREFFSLDEVIKICGVADNSLIGKRDRAAVAMGFISGMRVSALVTLPAHCVDLEKMAVYQLPEEGVETKNNKAQITYLLPVKELANIVIEWTKFVRKELGEKTLWYPNLNSDGEGWSKLEKVGGVESRRQSLSRGLKKFCKRAGIKYRSPHKLRHGHGIYGVKRVSTLEEYKAFSQNMGHDTLEVTDRIYGRLGGEDVRGIISRLERKSSEPESDKEKLFEEFTEYLEWKARKKGKG